MDRLSVDRIMGRIEPFLETLLGPRGLFVVDITLRGQKGMRVLEVFIDGDAGVTTAACAEVSRALSRELDENVLRGEGYTLTVSSPGIDRPLKFPRQYAKHVGREILLDVRSDGGNARIRGTLMETGDGVIRVAVAGGGTSLEIPYADIIEATVKPRW